jgi:hypothetical protein
MTRRIFDLPPVNWRDLQRQVQQAFAEMGCDAESDVHISTARGVVDVDVLATDNSHIPMATYLVECKLWKRRIPKTVAHAFRTVVADCGANAGFIVSEAGFQKGTREAVSNSNVTLLTWTEFQDCFFDRWVTARSMRLRKAAAPLREFMHGMSAPVSSIVGRSEEAQTLWYAMFGKFSAYVPWLANNREEEASFPITCVDPRLERNGYTSFSSAREFFDVLEAAVPLAIAETERFVTHFTPSE